MKRFARHAQIFLASLLVVSCIGPFASRRKSSDNDVEPILAYIHTSWKTLTRTHKNLVAAAEDSKLAHGAPWVVYVPATDIEDATKRISSALDPKGRNDIILKSLPADLSQFEEPGLLYLPNPYVVPGGRFNEMYGWDSYFILLGLLRDNEVDLAKGMVDNFLYEIAHYGTILNANRSYYVTRSQPPFLTRMLLEVYERTKDKAWLEKSLPSILAYYQYWTEPPHALPGYGLARYYDRGVGPAPEVVSGEIEDGKNHYERVREYYREHPAHVDGYPLSEVYDADADQLLPEFYVGDRSMRESGFDPSGRFGTFNVGVTRYAPVCLNTLLWTMERDAAQILNILGREGADAWNVKAEMRKRAIDELLWDENRGMYFDGDIAAKTRREYPFATTFFPMWAGVASEAQAARVVANLPLFERPGGIVTSDRVSGAQWDAPFGWAPLQLIAIEGLRRYGYAAEADRLSVAFLSLVLQEFDEHEVIFEKYDVEKRDSMAEAKVKFGYSDNVIGFGWTNATWERLWDQLPEAARATVVKKAHEGAEAAGAGKVAGSDGFGFTAR